MAIRRMVAGDRDFVVDGLIELQACERSLHSSRRRPSAALCTEYLDEIRRLAADNRGAILVADDDGRRLGFVSFWIESNASLIETDDANRCGFVSDLYVAPAARGRGLAARLLEAVETALAGDSGVTRIRICALAANGPALSAYARAGFEPYEVAYEKRVCRLPG